MSRQQNEIIPMKKQLLIFLTICCFPFMLNAKMPERTPENIGKYKELCRAHMYKDMKGMYLSLIHI